MKFTANKSLNVDDVKSIISTLSLQEQFNSFVAIVDTILFTESSDNYWDLISKNSYKDDYEKILEFLSPGGQFMNFLLKEMPTDKSIHSFEFPLNRLSLCTQKSIATNSVPIFISSKLHSKVQGSHNSILLLNAFEYYMFSFFSYIYHPSVARRVDWNGGTDSIYCQLVFRYLDMFLFNCSQSSLLMQLALPSRNRSSYNPAFSRSPNGSFSSFTVNSPFHDSILGRSRFMGKETKTFDVAELYFTETIVQVINEFWLNVSTESNVPNGSPLKVGLSAVPNLCERPTVDQVCLVRVFLKHTYHFCYANCVSHLTPESQMECEFLAKLNIYRQKVLPKFLISKIYCYLQYCFRVWPADLSFKIVLETWLSAIQPWRYTDLAHHQHNDHDNSSMIVVDDWQSFVADNLDLYLQLMLSFVRRMQKMDLNVLRNGQMFFRVAKVLSQSNLGSFMTKHQSLSSRSIAGRHSQDEAIWAEIQMQMSLLFVELDRTLLKLEMDESNTAKGWLQSIWDSMNSEVHSSNNPRRLMAYLQQSRSLLCSVMAMEPSTTVSRSADRNDYLEYKNSQAEHVVTYRGSQLTEFGRFQVAHGLCRLDTECQLDYYRRPVCSYEVAALVTACRRLSGLAMNQFEEPIRAWCVRPDLPGRLCRYLFIGQRMPALADDDSHGDIDTWVDSHRPQLRIRFLASKAFLFWSCVTALVLYLATGTGLWPMIIGSIVLYLLVSLARVLVSGFV